MRDLFVGGTGVMLGGLVGVAGTLCLEGLIVGVVAATLVFSAAPAPMEVAAPAAAPRAAQTAPARPKQVEAPGELQLMTSAAVQVMVDGVPMVWDAGQGWLAELPPGTHRVEVSDLLMRPVATADVEVVAGQRTQLRWAGKQLSDLGRVPMLRGTVTRRAPVAPVVAVAAEVERAEVEIERAEQEIGRAMVEVEAAVEQVERHQDAVEAVVGGLLSIGGAGRLPRLGRGR